MLKLKPVWQKQKLVDSYTYKNTQKVLRTNVDKRVCLYSEARNDPKQTAQQSVMAQSNFFCVDSFLLRY